MTTSTSSTESQPPAEASADGSAIRARLFAGLEAARAAVPGLARLQEQQLQQVLEDLAARLPAASDVILAANRLDLVRMDPADPRHDRLRLDPDRLASIAADLRKVAALPSPVGEVLESRRLENGLELRKVRVPMGVVAIIFESRPNVTFDVFALCFRTRNACVLKGSGDARHSNAAIVSLVHEVLAAHGIDKNCVFLAPAERECLADLLGARGLVDLAIPRGSQGLIDHVRQHARIPVIETGAGIVHTYVDASADFDQARAIVTNAKARRVSVCNALDTLLLHRAWLPRLPELLSDLGTTHDAEVFADPEALAALEGHYAAPLQAAQPEHYGTEFLSMRMSVKTVGGLDEALAHIARYSSKHSEAVVASDPDVIERFLAEVDAAAVFANTSTAFTDGAQFGMGAEIGISTQKLHARGPMGLPELTTYKWLVRGNGQVRP